MMLLTCSVLAVATVPADTSPMIACEPIHFNLADVTSSQQQGIQSTECITDTTKRRPPTWTLASARFNPRLERHFERSEQQQLPLTDNVSLTSSGLTYVREF